jgi:hypothetical protein
MNRFMSSRLLAVTSLVLMGLRPAGFSLMEMTFRSPYSVMAKLLGIGVALMTSMSG